MILTDVRLNIDHYILLLPLVVHWQYISHLLISYQVSPNNFIRSFLLLSFVREMINDCGDIVLLIILLHLR